MTTIEDTTAFYDSLNTKIKNDTLILPTLPAIAFKVRDACDDPDIDANQISKVISLDIGLSARIIRVSNSAHLNRGVKVKGVKEAIVRIGLRNIKNIATALAMEQLFVSNHEKIQRKLASIWKDTITVAAHSVAALSLAPPSVKRAFSNDVLMLSALVYNIGALPIIKEFEGSSKFVDDPKLLNQAIREMGPTVGASILESWDFDKIFIDVAQHSLSTDYDTETIEYLDWVRLGIMAAGFYPKYKKVVVDAAIAKGMLPSSSALHSSSFSRARDDIAAIFKDD